MIDLSSATRGDLLGLLSRADSLIRRARELRALISERLRRQATLERLGAGDSLAARCIRLGLSQREVARRVHMSRGLIADLEVGRRVTARSTAEYEAVLARLEAERAQ